MDVALAEVKLIGGRICPVAGLVGGGVIDNDSGEAFYSDSFGGFFADLVVDLVVEGAPML